MKFLLIFIFICLNLFSYVIEEGREDQVSQEEPKQLLESISKYAIRIGTGSLNTHYVFVEPMCKHSKNYIKIITADKMKLIQSSFYFFLYRLEKYESDDLIQFIYQNKDVKATFLDHMVKAKEFDLFDVEADENTSKMIQEISEVGEKFEMKKRPYIITFEQGSKYCRVSDGSAPCLEELDFDSK